ncbi:hypothetical protein XH89_13395 [Bradyrhizobium sp. CCBAU 53340]|nr:hypothetical protein XH89_13395 [Bradyrhizobium sp. CCBAU 53340]
MRRSNPEFLNGTNLDCFAEPVIGPRVARTRWLAMTSGERPTSTPRRSRPSDTSSASPIRSTSAPAH